MVKKKSTKNPIQTENITKPHRAKLTINSYSPEKSQNRTESQNTIYCVGKDPFGSSSPTPGLAEDTPIIIPWIRSMLTKCDKNYHMNSLLAQYLYFSTFLIILGWSASQPYK